MWTFGRDDELCCCGWPELEELWGQALTIYSFREESGGAVGVHGTEAVKEFVDDGAGIRDLLALLDALVDQGYKCAG